MEKNIRVKVIEPFNFSKEPETIYPRGHKMWVDRETFEKLNNQNLVKIMEVKKEVCLK